MLSSQISNVIVERAQLLIAIVQKRKLNLGNLIYDQIATYLGAGEPLTEHIALDTTQPVQKMENK